MPFIQIKSLPLNKPLDLPNILLGITRDFADKTGIQLEHIHTTWVFFNPGHYAKGGQTPVFQPTSNHPIIVDLLTPDFNQSGTVALMLKTIAKSLSQRANFPLDNIFINHRQAHSGMVFDDAELVEW